MRAGVWTPLALAALVVGYNAPAQAATSLADLPKVATTPAPVLPPVAGPAVLPAEPATTPTFEEVLAAPDDTVINIAYAQSQERAGHMLAAAAALERILLQQPDYDAVRLRYIDILLKLDDPAGARREIDKLDPLTLAADQRTRLTEDVARLDLARQTR